MRGLKERAMGKLSKKLKDATPSLVNFAVDNNQAYNNLIQTIKDINKRRQANGKFIFDISVKPSLKLRSESGSGRKAG